MDSEPHVRNLALKAAQAMSQSLQGWSCSSDSRGRVLCVRRGIQELPVLIGIVRGLEQTARENYQDRAELTERAQSADKDTNGRKDSLLSNCRAVSRG